MREALVRLEREGFAIGERNHGLRVAPLDEQTAREISPLFGALQGLALAESAPLSASLLDALRAANDRPKGATDTARSA